jgi:uncharacterized protein (DUF1684 family)
VTRQCVPGLVLLAAITVAHCGGGAPPQGADYAREISAARAAKDAVFANPADSPIPAERRTEFLPLSYFPPDPACAVPADLTPATTRIVVRMPTSTGEVRSMDRVGTLGFMLKGQPLSLGAFVESGSADVNRLFVPFADLTSGTETYAAGRYLDLDRTPTGIYVIDFNKAYHPYCYYNPTFDCPYPPAENRLPVPVRAGERLRQQTSAGR